ncbi:Bicarbonate transporter BicA [Stieleria neptunia]|uniref:Bicarbonate transporter BicA n=1 Tax=Stieleria neptunia TaxID=2527979 RepID=A0A518HWB4_9BACT|nr:SulP family inorganic anion transporter [Stieleria neptunia]QDV45113.1 Bicarbonate transporter BicA [Stieleria neptunia]
MLNFFRAGTANAKDDLLSGLTVALALVPEAVAFAFVAGVSPLIGLYSAFFIGLITAAFGGRPGMISGATGAMAVVVVALVAMHGVEYLFPAVILCGIFQITVGVARLGKLIRMVPHSVMLGFVNGLAIVIGMAQLGSFKTLDLSTGNLVYLTGPRLYVMLGLVAITMLIIYLLPKLTRALPASLVAILSVTFLSVAINRSGVISGDEITPNAVATVGDMLKTNFKASQITEARQNDPTNVASDELLAEFRRVSYQNDEVVGPVLRDPATDAAEVEPAGGDEESSISGGLPMPFFLQYTVPPMTMETLWIILPFSLTLAGVGLIESLMTLTLIDEITETRGRGNRECVGQGAANILCGLFGGMGGCAMIGQSLINVNSGGRGRLSGITAAVCLLAFILFLAPWIEQIPMAALVGVMFMVVIGTFEWASLKMVRRVPRADFAVMLLVAGYTVIMHDLATAVILGVIVSACVFTWTHATHLGAETQINEYGSKIYQLHGPLFFASATSFKELFDVHKDPDDVVIDFYYTRVYDQSGLEAINVLAEKYESAGKRLHLTHLSDECRGLLDKAGDLVEVNLSEDPQYHVATDRLG